MKKIRKPQLNSNIESILNKINPMSLVTSQNGSFAGLVQDGETWLLIGQRLTTSDSIVLVATRYDSVMYISQLHCSTRMTYNFNNYGTVALLWNNSGTNVFSGAIRLFKF